MPDDDWDDGLDDLILHEECDGESLPLTELMDSLDSPSYIQVAELEVLMPPGTCWNVIREEHFQSRRSNWKQAREAAIIFIVRGLAGSALAFGLVWVIQEIFG
jgi:hypothetical protein